MTRDINRFLQSTTSDIYKTLVLERYAIEEGDKAFNEISTILKFPEVYSDNLVLVALNCIYCLSDGCHTQLRPDIEFFCASSNDEIRHTADLLRQFIILKGML